MNIPTPVSNISSRLFGISNNNEVEKVNSYGEIHIYEISSCGEDVTICFDESENEASVFIKTGVECELITAGEEQIQTEAFYKMISSIFS